MLNTQRWSGCHGSTHLAYSNRLGTFRQRSTKHSFKSRLRNFSSQQLRLEHSNNRASDEPGAIHIVFSGPMSELRQTLTIPATHRTRTTGILVIPAAPSESLDPCGLATWRPEF